MDGGKNGGLQFVHGARKYRFLPDYTAVNFFSLQGAGEVRAGGCGRKASI